MGTIQDIANTIRGHLIPELFILRRVPMRYWEVLPLAVMKKFQCVVVGSVPGVWTVAITDRQNTLAIESLRKFTGQSIFPILIDPTLMRLLIKRIERNEYLRQVFHLRATRSVRKLEYYQYALLCHKVDTIITLLSSQKIQRL